MTFHPMYFEIPDTGFFFKFSINPLYDLTGCRFEDWSSQKSPSIDDLALGRSKKVDLVSATLQKMFGWVSQIRKSMASCMPSRYSPDDQSLSKKKILDPQGSFLQQWNKIFVLTCVLAIAVDPLFFYIPVVRDSEKCLYLDRTLSITASVLRFFTDIFYIIHIIFQFRTGFIAPSSRVFGRGVLVENTYEIARRYLGSYFIVDVLAVLPIPQVNNSFFLLFFWHICFICFG